MKINLDLLKKILLIDRSSKNEYPILNFIWNYLHGVPNLTFELDHYGNLFITKNTTNPTYYPCIIAHTDCIITWKGNRTIVNHNGVLMGQHVNDYSRCGITADDSCGIYAALEILNEVSNLKICLTTEEEIGGVGAQQAAYNVDFFADVAYFLQADRRGKSDLITNTNCLDVCSKEFLKKINKSMKKFGYSENYGTFTDVGVLVEQFKISGVNISCGYKQEHTFNEHLVLSDLENCINFMLDIINNVPLDKQYDVKIDYYGSYYGRYYNYGNNFQNNYNTTINLNPSESKNLEKNELTPDNYIYEIPCDMCSTFDCMNCDKIRYF